MPTTFYNKEALSTKHVFLFKLSSGLIKVFLIFRLTAPFGTADGNYFFLKNCLNYFLKQSCKLQNYDIIQLTLMQVCINNCRTNVISNI